VSPVKYELDFYIPEKAILHSHCRENLKSYTTENTLVESVTFPLFIKKWQIAILTAIRNVLRG
jgi:hypothetical protein